MSRIQPLGRRRLRRSPPSAVPAAWARHMSSIAAIASDMLTHSCTSSELRTSATSILGIAPDEKLRVLARCRSDAAAQEALAQNAHLAVVDARQRLADRPAVEAVQPVLVLPQLPVNQA